MNKYVNLKIIKSEEEIQEIRTNLNDALRIITQDSSNLKKYFPQQENTEKYQKDIDLLENIIIQIDKIISDLGDLIQS